MRRSQRNSGSQPVRNLYTNPGAEAAGATVTVRTNLALDPNGTSTTNWGLVGSPTATRTVDSSVFHSGSTAIRDTLTSAGNSGIKALALNPGFVTGDTVRWSLWVYSSIAQSIQPYWERSTPTYTGGPGGSAVAVPANTWTQIIGTVTFSAAQADATGLFGFGAYGNTTTFAIGDYLIGDEALIERSIALGAFFAGDTAAGNDFTYGWSGAANASASNQNAVGVASTSMQNCSVIQSTDWAASGSKSFRIIPGPTATTDTSCNLPVALQNKTYTLLATCRVKAPQTGSWDALRARRIQLYFTGTGPSASAQAPNVVGVYQLSVTFTVTDYTQYNSLRLYNGASAGNGDIWWDNIMLVEGAYTGDYVDGTKPFSKWDGTANASTSVGYPQQLLDLAGKPDVDLVGVASTGGVAIPVNATGPRTIYACYEAFANTQNYHNWLSYGIAGSKGFMLQTAAAGSNSMATRFDFPGGSSNGAIVLANGRTTQRHVAAFAFNNGLTSATACVDGASDGVTVLTPGTGWDDGRVAAFSSTEGTAVRALVFYAEHDRATRLAISRYLGNKYGANVA